jgi:hypothetical protein
MEPPYAQIRALYQRRSLALTWEQLVGWHLADPLAYVIKEPDFFIMGRAVRKDASPDDIRDLRIRFERGCDAWFIYAFAGDMGRALDALLAKSHTYRFIAFERFDREEKELHFMETARIREKLTDGLQTFHAGHADDVCAPGAAHRR